GVWGAAEYGGSVAQAVCGSWAGRAAGSGAAGPDRQIWRGSAPAGFAPTGIAAAQGVGQLGWGFSGRRAGGLGRCGLAPAAQGRRPIAPAALLVRQRRPTICGPACPWPEQGAADFIGLYLNPPENALVLRGDEKPAI